MRDFGSAKNLDIYNNKSPIIRSREVKNPIISMDNEKDISLNEGIRLQKVRIELRTSNIDSEEPTP